MPNAEKPIVGILMGSESDWEGTMEFASSTLHELGIDHEKRVTSAHRTSELVEQYASEARARGIQVIIAGAGGAAHLPGMVAAQAKGLPVIGVPVQSKALSGVDSLYSIVQMPPEVPVATMAIGKPGAINAAIFAAQILALSDADIAKRLEERREEIRQKVFAMNERIAAK